jgi:hypothetical protein
VVTSYETPAAAQTLAFKPGASSALSMISFPASSYTTTKATTGSLVLHNRFDRAIDAIDAKEDVSTYSVVAYGNTIEHSDTHTQHSTILGSLLPLDDGTYEISVPITFAGPWQVHFTEAFRTFEEEFIDSPVTVNVIAGETSASGCLIEYDKVVEAGDHFELHLDTYGREQRAKRVTPNTPSE